jgi:hypothetical protein
MRRYGPGSLVVGVLAVGLVSSLAFAIGAFLQSSPSLLFGGTWRTILEVALLFATIGLLYGCVAALDSGSPLSMGNYPLSRTLLCGVIGGAAVLVVQWRWPVTFGLEWAAAGVVVGSFLGWLGWRWAKYVDF